MNKAILVLNAIILSVTFVLAYMSTESQVGVLQATARASSQPLRQSPVGATNPGFLRLVLALDGTNVTHDDLATIERAYDRYVDAVSSGLRSVPQKGPPLQPYRELAKEAREVAVQELRTTIGDEGLVARIASLILAHAQ